MHILGYLCGCAFSALLLTCQRNQLLECLMSLHLVLWGNTELPYKVFGPLFHFHPQQTRSIATLHPHQHLKNNHKNFKYHKYFHYVTHLSVQLFLDMDFILHLDTDFFSTPKQIYNTIFYEKGKQANLAYCSVTCENLSMCVFAWGVVVNLDRIRLQNPLFELS